MSENPTVSHSSQCSRSTSRLLLGRCGVAIQGAGWAGCEEEGEEDEASPLLVEQCWLVVVESRAVAVVVALAGLPVECVVVAGSAPPAVRARSCAVRAWP